MKEISMHADSSSSSATVKYLVDQRSESSMSATMSESMVSMTSSSQMKKMEMFSSELKMGETPSCESNILLHPQ